MRKSTYVSIGAFVVTATILAIIACIVLGAFSFNKHKILLETYFAGTVQGVSQGSPVKYRGIPVGQVESVGAAWRTYDAPMTDEGMRAGHYARIVFSITPGKTKRNHRIEKDLKEQIKQGMRVSMKNQGITGGMFIDIDYYRTPPPLLPVPWEPEYQYIPSVPSFTKTMTDALLLVAKDIGKLGQLASSALELLDEVDGTVGDGRTATQEIIDNVERASRNMADAMERIKDDPSLLLRNSKNQFNEGFE